jgi:hypothetical protein
MLLFFLLSAREKTKVVKRIQRRSEIKYVDTSVIYKVYNKKKERGVRRRLLKENGLLLTEVNLKDIVTA